MSFLTTKQASDTPMQTSESPHPFISAVFQWVATILGSGIAGIFFKDWLDRRRERRKETAEAGVNAARVRSLDSETVAGTSERMIKLFDKIHQLNDEVAKERRRADEAEIKAADEYNDRVRAERALARCESDLELTVLQMQDLHAAASLQKVSIANHSPDDLKREIERLFLESRVGRKDSTATEV